MRTVRSLVIAVGSVALAYMAGTQAFGIWGGRFMPDAALTLDARSPSALTNLTERAWQEKSKVSFKRMADANTLTVLKDEPLSHRALRQRGSYYAVTGNTAKARELIALSTKLTRRDSFGQLYLVEEYGRTGQLDKALGAFDIVVRTQPDAREAAYRMMGTALADSEFRNAFIKLARRNPPWLSSFLAFNVGEATRPSDVAEVVRALQPLSPKTLPAAETGTLLSRLVMLAPIEDARALYLSLPGARPTTLTSLNFASPKTAFLYPPFGWEVFDNAGVQAFPGSDGKSASIEAVVLPGYRGIAARKLLFLGAGAYDWSGTADLTRMAPGAAARMILFCYDAPGKWARNSEVTLRNGANRFTISVPDACSAQLLSLELVGADNQTDSSMVLGAMMLSNAARK